MTGHTPTPWKLANHGCHIWGPKKDILCVVPNNPMNGENWKADSAFIVKAVNSHDHLVKALEASCGYMLNAKIDLATGTKADAIRTIEGGLLRANAVLALIKEPA